MRSELIYRVHGGIVYFNVENVRNETLNLGYNPDQPVRPSFSIFLAQGITLTLAEARAPVRYSLQAAGVMKGLGISDPVKSAGDPRLDGQELPAMLG